MSTEKKATTPGKKELPVLSFSRPEEWKAWLEQNNGNQEGVLLRLFKKATGIASVNYKEALDEALCYGWIDGQGKKFDDDSYLQKFTPRRPRSIWSKRNIENIARLESEGRMRPRGLREVEAAKADGRWSKAYDSPGNMTIPEDFYTELLKDKTAHTFFESLNRANKYAIAWRLQTAVKPETRKNRMKAILDMMSRGEKFH